MKEMASAAEETASVLYETEEGSISWDSWRGKRRWNEGGCPSCTEEGAISVSR